MPTPDPSRIIPVSLILDTVSPRWPEHVTRTGGIDFLGMRRALGHSSTESLRIDAARSLWNGSIRVNLAPVAYSLDDDNRAALLGALAVAPMALHGGAPPASRALMVAARRLEERGK